MKSKTLLILGGYGNLGRHLAPLILRYSDAHVIVAGRDINKAEQFAIDLDGRFQGERVLADCVDAASPEAMRKAFKGIDMLVVASSTVRYAEEVIRAALAAGVDYLDFHHSAEKTSVLFSLQSQIEAAKRLFITDGGLSPGLPAAMIRCAAANFDRMERARVGCVINANWDRIPLEPETVEELVRELAHGERRFLKGGAWKSAHLLGMAGSVKMDFGGSFGRRRCRPVYLEEMRVAAETYRLLDEAGFYMAGSNWVADWIAYPAALAAAKVSEALIPTAGELLIGAMARYSNPPYGTVIRAEVHGARDGKPLAVDVIVRNPDAHMLAAMAGAGTLMQYIDGSIKKRGLWTQGNLVDPDRLMQDIERMGAHVAMVSREAM